MTLDQRIQFVTAIGDLLDGTLDRVRADQLAQRLAEDVSLHALYLEAIALDVDLEGLRHSRSDRNTAGVGSETTVASPKHMPPFAQPESTRQMSPILLQKKRSFFSRPILQYVALVALCLYGSFVLIAWNLRPDALSGDDGFVAVVRDTANVEWPKNAASKSPNSSILSGEPLRIESGTIELELKMGATLVVDGPAEWSIDGDNGATLKAGKIVARVPSQAVGFTLSTPTAKIVDLGTEFGVEVNESGTTEVQVLKGKVELHPSQRESSTSVSEPITLSAGSARRIAFDEAKRAVVIENVTPNSQFAARRAPLSNSYQLSAGALASSEGAREFGRAANHLVNGSGLSKETHTNVADGTMWHSAYGKVNGEFVLFDLFRPCRIKSMKVWNYNENVHPADGHVTNMYEQRGVAEANIYVSTSGQGDPISRPQDWRLVVANQQFALADGTAKYSTPDVISLENVEARFVAIVIESRHHPELVSPGIVCVGLSEVQFFGERVPVKESLKRN
jgi:hypothetical protein